MAFFRFLTVSIIALLVMSGGGISLWASGTNEHQEEEEALARLNIYFHSDANSFFLGQDPRARVPLTYDPQTQTYDFARADIQKLSQKHQDSLKNRLRVTCYLNTYEAQATGTPLKRYEYFFDPLEQDPVAKALKNAQIGLWIFRVNAQVSPSGLLPSHQQGFIQTMKNVDPVLDSFFGGTPLLASSAMPLSEETLAAKTKKLYGKVCHTLYHNKHEKVKSEHLLIQRKYLKHEADMEKVEKELNRRWDEVSRRMKKYLDSLWDPEERKKHEQAFKEKERTRRLKIQEVKERYAFLSKEKYYVLLGCAPDGVCTFYSQGFKSKHEYLKELLGEAKKTKDTSFWQWIGLETNFDVHTCTEEEWLKACQVHPNFDPTQNSWGMASNVTKLRQAQGQTTIRWCTPSENEHFFLGAAKASASSLFIPKETQILPSKKEGLSHIYYSLQGSVHASALADRNDWWLLILRSLHENEKGLAQTQRQYNQYIHKWHSDAVPHIHPVT